MSTTCQNENAAVRRRFSLRRRCAVISSSHRRSSTPLSAWSHVVCVSNPCKKAVLISSVMFMSVHLPHREKDENNYITVLELSKVIMAEGKSRVTRTSSLAGITLSLHSKVEFFFFQGLDSLDGYCFYVPDCRGGGEDLVTYEQNVDACSN